MTMKTIRERFTEVFELSTGRRFHAHGHMLSIGPDDVNSDTLYYGYDGATDSEMPDNVPDEEYEAACKFTRQERAEIARYMANLWAEWGELPFRVD